MQPKKKKKKTLHTPSQQIKNLTIYLWSKVVCFDLSSWGLPNHGISCQALGISGKLSMSRRGFKPFSNLGLRLFGATCGKLLIIEPFSQWKLNKIETENCIGIWEVFLLALESPWQVRFNRVYFTIFRAKVCKKRLKFEWILLLEIQTNCRKLGLEGNIIWALNVCSHLG
jgi:hypothetical protein